MRRTIRTFDVRVKNLYVRVDLFFHVVHTSCPILIPKARGIVSDLDARLDVVFDLPLLLLPSSPNLSRNRSHSGAPVRFRHWTSLTSWFYDLFCTH